MQHSALLLCLALCTVFCDQQQDSASTIFFLYFSKSSAVGVDQSNSLCSAVAGYFHLFDGNLHLLEENIFIPYWWQLRPEGFGTFLSIQTAN